jgi:hypothetical protein
MDASRFDRDRGELDARGLYQDMPAWGYHVFEVSAPEVAEVDGRIADQLSSDRAPEVQTP